MDTSFAHTTQTYFQIDLGGFEANIAVYVEEGDHISYEAYEAISELRDVKAVINDEGQIVWTDDVSFMHPQNINGKNLNPIVFGQLHDFEGNMLLNISTDHIDACSINLANKLVNFYLSGLTDDIEIRYAIGPMRIKSLASQFSNKLIEFNLNNESPRQRRLF